MYCCVPARPGWFSHSATNNPSRSYPFWKRLSFDRQTVRQSYQLVLWWVFHATCLLSHHAMCCLSFWFSLSSSLASFFPTTTTIAFFYFVLLGFVLLMYDRHLRLWNWWEKLRAENFIVIVFTLLVKSLPHHFSKKKKASSQHTVEYERGYEVTKMQSPSRETNLWLSLCGLL